MKTAAKNIKCESVSCYADNGKRAKATRKVIVSGTGGHKETLHLCKSCADRVQGK